MRSAIAQKPENEKKNDSEHVNKITQKASQERGTETGMPLFLQGVVSSPNQSSKSEIQGVPENNGTSAELEELETEPSLENNPADGQSDDLSGQEDDSVVEIGGRMPDEGDDNAMQPHKAVAAKPQASAKSILETGKEHGDSVVIEQNSTLKHTSGKDTKVNDQKQANQTAIGAKSKPGLEKTMDQQGELFGQMPKPEDHSRLKEKTEAQSAKKDGMKSKGRPKPQQQGIAETSSVTLGKKLVEGGEDKESAAESGTVAAVDKGPEGGGDVASDAGGGDPQGGTEEEGIAELDDVLASADPERAAADEADPAEVALGNDDEAVGDESNGQEPLEMIASNSMDLATTEFENDISPTAPDNENTQPSSAAIAGESNAMKESFASATSDPRATGETSVTEEDATVDGFSGDEPALGGGAIFQSEPPDLSEPEKSAALESISQNTGGGGSPGGGGGGGGAVPDTPVPDVPDVSSDTPGVALGKVGALPPVQLKQALDGVSSAVGKVAGDERSELAADLPKVDRPSGSPKNLHGQSSSKTLAKGKVAAKVKKAQEGVDQPVPEPESLPTPPPSPADQIQEPMIIGGEGGELSESEVNSLSSSMSNLPTSDPGLNVNAGPAPAVDLSGNADPAQTDEQQGQLQASVIKTETEGRNDVAQEMGENTKVFPSFAAEKLTAKAPIGGGAGGKAGAAAGGAAGEESISIIAQEEKGSEIQAAVGKAQGDMAAQQDEYASKVSEEKVSSNNEIAQLEAENAANQATARSEVQAEVGGKKSEWSNEQKNIVSEANKEADDKVVKGRKEVQKQKQEADRTATKEIKKGNDEAVSERQKAEKKAQAEKRKGEKKKSGFFGWLASKATAFFNAIKSAIKSAFDLARKAIKKAIELAKKAAMWAIEQARKAIVAAIKAVGAALIAIGDRLLAAFPALRDKFRKFIQDKVDSAVKKVNAFADQLKKDVAAALDALAAGLDKLIGWLEKGMLAVVDAVASAVDGAIKFAEKVADLLGAFAVLIKDIAGNPGQWLSNLGASVVDGIKNHLWGAFSMAVKKWFNSKLDQVLGLGAMVWGLIKSGGLSLAKIGAMAWGGLKAMIPPTLTRILVEKLVAMIVPAAGAVMVVIEGLQAAWGTVSQIIAAFGQFVTFLKAVKSGGAGPKFAAALASAAIVVIDFIANWLIAKLAKGAAKIGGKIKGLAKKILGRKKGRKKGKKSRSRAKGPVKKRKAQTPKKVSKSKKPKKTGKEKKEDRKKNKDKKNRERLEKAKRELTPKINRMLARGVSRLRLKIALVGWKIRYRLTELSLKSSGIYARVNPGDILTPVEILRRQAIGRALEPVLKEAERLFFERRRSARTDQERKHVSDAKSATEGSSKNFLDLPTPEQVEFFRNIKSGDIKLPPPVPGIKKGTLRNPLVRPGEPGFSTYINDPKLLSKAFVLGAGAYPIPEKRLERPSVKGLVGALEPARAEGMFAASEVSRGLVQHDRATRKETHTGELAPMATIGSSRAVEIEAQQRKPSTDPHIKKDDAAQVTRHERLGNIFSRLDSLVDKPPVDLVSKPGATAAINELAQAFRGWLRTHFPYDKAGASEEEIKVSILALQAKLIAFLNTMNSRK